MGYLVPPPSPRLNLDRYGLPRDYATYVWLLYRKHVDDRSPERQAFLHGPKPDGDAFSHPDLGQQWIMR